MHDVDSDKRPKRPLRLIWLRRLVIIAVAFELLYVIAANAMLRTGTLERLINRKPEKMLITWDAASTWFPGVVHVNGFAMRRQGRSNQMYIEAPRLRAVISLLKLPLKTLHVRSAHADSLDFRLRRRLDWVAPDQDTATATQPAGAEYFPEIPGLSNPPDAKPEDLYPKKHRRRPWTIKLRGIHVDGPIHAAMNQLSLAGDGIVAAGVTIKSREAVTIHRARLQVEPLTVVAAGDTVTDDLALRIAIKARPFEIPKPQVADILDGVTGTVFISGTLGDKIAVARRITPGISARGSGRIDAQLEIDDGVLQPSSQLELDSPEFEVNLMALRMIGSGLVRLETERSDGRPISSAHIELPTYRVEAPTETSADITGSGLVLDASWPAFAIAKPSPPSTVTIDLPDTHIPDVRALNGLIPDQAPIKMLSGSASMAAGFRVNESGTATGELTLEADDISLESRGQAHRADLAVRATLAEGSLPDRRFALVDTSIRVEDVREDRLTEKQQQRLAEWYSDVTIDPGTVTFGKPIAVTGKLAVKMADIKPVFALLREFGNTPKWLAIVPDIKDIDGRFALDMAQGRTSLDDIDITGKGLEVLGWMHVEAKKGNGRLYVKYKGLAAGLSMDDGKTGIHLVEPRNWFDQQPRE